MKRTLHFKGCRLIAVSWAPKQPTVVTISQEIEVEPDVDDGPEVAPPQGERKGGWGRPFANSRSDSATIGISKNVYYQRVKLLCGYGVHSAGTCYSCGPAVRHSTRWWMSREGLIRPGPADLMR